MNKTDKRHERRGGFYWVDGKPFVSVTNVLKVIDKPALRYWFGKEVYLAMVKDPYLAEKEALSAPYKTSDKAKARGTTVHSIVEAYKVSGKKIDGIPEEFKGYAKAFYKWIEDNSAEILENEKTVINKKEEYAGTLDLLIRKNGDTWVVDVKTGKDIYMEAHLQLSAYKKCTDATRAGVLLLKDTGTYKFEESDDYYEAFLHTKALWEFINKEKLEKLKT